MASNAAFLLLPQGRDPQVANGLLHEIGVETQAFKDAEQLGAALGDDVGFVIATEEALVSTNLRPIGSWIEAQPAWSDLPFIILTRRGGGLERNPSAARLSEVLGNVTFLERPFHPTTLVSLARSALKARRRQHDIKAHLEAIRDSEARLRAANASLEERVIERTAELSFAHKKMLEEIEQRQRAEEQLRHAQKMEMIGQLTGGVAHDFNNLLMAVSANLDLLRKHLPGDPKTARLIDGALQGAQRGAALTQRLLAFARRQDLQVVPTDMSALVIGMRDLLSRSVGQAIDLRFDLPAHPVSALVDANQIELALLNLAVNARDAMPDGGILTIKLDTARSEADGDLNSGSYVRLTVSDTGSGMDEATLARAIEPFFSTKQLGKGTGLGLSMIHGLAVQLHGALQLKSEPGKGTTAILWLPSTEARVAEREAAPTSHLDGDGDAVKKKTILLVDDDALIAMSSADMLEDLGHDVIEAHSGTKALEILRNGRKVDLLITDYSMPGMTGAQLARSALELFPTMPIILATGYAELPPDAGVDLPRLSKPYFQDQLAAEIAKVFRETAH